MLDLNCRRLLSCSHSIDDCTVTDALQPPVSGSLPGAPLQDEERPACISQEN